MKPKQMSKKQLEKAVNDFNQRWPVGSEVMLKEDGKDELTRTKTRSEAYVMCGHTPVVFLEGISGAYHTRCVSAAQPL